MPEIKLQHILTLVQLLAKGARHNFVEVTTGGLGKNIGRSQQAASKHLLDLETEGYIERVRRGQKFAVRVTDKGFSEIENLFASLKSALESAPASIDFEGTVVSGMGEGAYYMSLEGYRKQFKEKLGYEPYPGTLNVRLVDPLYMTARRELGRHPSIFVDGFSDGTRTYGWVKCYRATIDGVENAAALVLERTHYDDSMLEVIAPVSIKDSAGIKVGDKVKVRVQIQMP
ncbi:CTP-dependent riboflavin kinase [Nitrososphaera sp.]|uniref:CTP-dependent riboflavin kinase n=1 Tax=Nitrososphaera sp. TaxID=1971748 RepID=UPI0018207594|nr:CTP-dependent riboflavin kinase [Nitrososphaera sp.]NWG37355.1 CTP-dependent riboflavin kinase [Nitrososphaera sp.]